MQRTALYISILIYEYEFKQDSPGLGPDIQRFTGELDDDSSWSLCNCPDVCRNRLNCGPRHFHSRLGTSRYSLDKVDLSPVYEAG